MRAARLLTIAVLAPALAFAEGWQSRTVAGVGAHLYVPASEGTRGNGRGLLVALHGCTQSNTQLRDLGNFAGAADAWGLAVALPAVPNGGVIAGCWDYYGDQHTRTNRHNKAVLDLVAGLLADASLGLDPAQVYVAGISSGATEAMVLGCLAPEVFAGIGMAAGPTLGTSSMQIGYVATNRNAAVTLCTNLAGNKADSLRTQIASIIQGTSDYTVAQGYAPLNAEVYGALSGASLTQGSFDVTALEGVQPAGTGTHWSDAVGPRVSLIAASGMGHAWPAGSGTGGETSYVARRGVNYPAYLAAFFTENNRRVVDPVEPVDAGTADAGTGADAGGADAGFDAGSAPDAGAIDAGAIADAGRTDAGTPDPGEEPEEADRGGCATAGSAGVLAAVVIALRRRRR